MKWCFIRRRKSFKLGILLGVTIASVVVWANLSYGGIVVQLQHVNPGQHPQIEAFVTVEDENGDSITDLTASDFSVSEDGNPQTLTSFMYDPPSDDPVSVALVMDYSGSIVEAGAIESMETAALALIDQLRDGYDSCEIIKFDDVISVVQKFTIDKILLRDAVTSPWTTTMGSTKLYDALWTAVEDTASYADSQGSQGSVVVISDGKDFADPGYSASTHSLEEVISLAMTNGVTIFTVGFGYVDAEVLQRLADETGGRYFYAPTSQQIEDIYRTIITLLNEGGYVVSYDTSVTDCEYHTMQVTVTTSSGLVGEDTKSSLLCAQPLDESDSTSSGGSLIKVSGGGGGG